MILLFERLKSFKVCVQNCVFYLGEPEHVSGDQVYILTFSQVLSDSFKHKDKTCIKLHLLLVYLEM